MRSDTAGDGITLGALHAAPGWYWLVCARPSCGRSTAVALAPLIIRWGASTPAARLEQAGRCQACGGRGALLRHPSWADMTRGWQPFPLKKVSAA